MKSGKSLRIIGFLVLFALMAWAFVMIIWIPLYGHRQTASFAETQEEAPLQAEIVREDASGTRSWSIADQQALSKLRNGLRRADYTGVKEPHADQKYRVRLRRPDSRIDEYEVILDERGSEHDVLYVVHRTANGEWLKLMQSPPAIARGVQISTFPTKPEAVKAGSCSDQTLNVNPPLRLNAKAVAVIKPTEQDGLTIVGCQVLAADKVRVTFSNSLTTDLLPVAEDIQLFTYV